MRAVFPQSHRDLAVDTLPDALFPRVGRLGLIDYERVFCPDLTRGRDIFDARGIDRERGALVVVRPDQFVAAILPVEAHAELADFLDGVLLPSV